MCWQMTAVFLVSVQGEEINLAFCGHKFLNKRKENLLKKKNLYKCSKGYKNSQIKDKKYKEKEKEKL